MKWEPVIGLEVHVQLKTHSKIFSGAATRYGALPNSQACAIDLAMPGTLPVLNKEVVAMAIKLGLAINAKIASRSILARKNYFYPDLPKGYQISQLDLPIIQQGKLAITLDDNLQKTINITRAHLEEDAGKSLHEDFNGMTGIDLNRAGVPLLEIVSEPEMHSAEEAVSYLKALHALVCYLEICDGNMQEGSFRCDANVSIRPHGTSKLGTRTELKNINSFRFVERAIKLEIQRQIDILEESGTIIQETRLFDPDRNETRSMRTKEEANDYRYFPDPDLLPIDISEDLINQIKNDLPELPTEKQQRFCRDYKLNEYDANMLVSEKALADYFEAVMENSTLSSKLVANWIIGELTAALNNNNLNITQSPISATALAGLLSRIEDQTISGKLAKTVFDTMWMEKRSADDIIAQQGLHQVSDDKLLNDLIDQVISQNPAQVAQYRSGKDKIFGFFVGQIMKLTQGKANPQRLNDLLKKKLDV